MLQKKKLSTPTTRFASLIKIDDFKGYFWKKKVNNKINNQLNKKFFSKHKSYLITFNDNINSCGVISSFLYNKKPHQVFLQVKSIYNNKFIIPGIDLVFPGIKFFNLTGDISFNKISFLGSQIVLDKLPFGLKVSSISNNLNQKWTFSKSSGSFSTKLKAKKNVKMVLVELSSGVTYLFFKRTKCFIGENFNFFNNKFYEGKWGFSIHKKKKIVVRGVAMNPVDHPNGGRTKSKQPEKSPWGWIAKNNK